METTLNNKFFDFEKAKVQTLSLDQLARTHKENDIYGKPLRGIYHYDLLNQIIGMCNAQNYDVEVYDLFAAMFTLIGMLTALRVKCDTHIAEIRENRTYPLNQSQISRLTEDMMYRYYQNGKVTVWDLYNGATELYKADTMDIPALLPQNRAMVGFLSEQFGI